MEKSNSYLIASDVNLAVAGLCLYMGGSKMAPAAVGVALSAIVQGDRPSVPFHKRDSGSDLKVLYSGALIAIGFCYSNVSLKTQVIAGSLLWTSQIFVQELFTQYNA